MAHGPCGEEFKAAFSCFVYSEEEPKGIDCVEKFKAMQNCFREHPDVYGEGACLRVVAMRHSDDVLYPQRFWVTMTTTRKVLLLLSPSSLEPRLQHLFLSVLLPASRPTHSLPLLIRTLAYSHTYHYIAHYTSIALLLITPQ